MNCADQLLDSIVAELRNMPATLSGEGTPFASTWDEIKEQVQNEESIYWDAYLETMQALVEGAIAELNSPQRQELMSLVEVDCEQSVQIEPEDSVLNLLLERAGAEQIELEDFDFKYFYYRPAIRPAGFCVYGEVVRRKSLSTCDVKAWSIAAPFGEVGELDVSSIEETMTEEQFQAARQAGWPEEWNGA